MSRRRPCSKPSTHRTNRKRRKGPTPPRIIYLTDPGWLMPLDWFLPKDRPIIAALREAGGSITVTQAELDGIRRMTRR